MVSDHGEGSRSQWTTVKVRMDDQDEKAQSAESTPRMVPPSECLEKKSMCLHNRGKKDTVVDVLYL